MQTSSSRKWVRRVGALLAAAVLTGSAPEPARAQSQGLDANMTIGLLVVVVGVFGWVAWQMEKEDRADQTQIGALLPLFANDADAAAFGLIFAPELQPDARLTYTAGMGFGRRF